MSEQAMQAHAELLKSKACVRVLTDLSLLEMGVAMSPETLVDRWIVSARVDGIERRHLEAVRRQVGLQYHPDKGGNARLMTTANAALDAALVELDRLTALDVKIIQTRSKTVA